MKIKNIIIGVATTAMVVPLTTSCEDYLDVDKYFYDTTSLDSMFIRKDNLYAYMNAASTALPDDDAMWTSADDPFRFTSDEAFCSWNDVRHAGIKYALGELDKFSYYTSNSTTYYYFDNWSTRYKGIRRANMIIQRINECQDMTELERRDATGQAYFLRAYLYYSLVRQYGPVPILPDNVIESNTSIEDMSYPRGTYDECIDYIVKNLNTAASLLDNQRSTTNSYQVATKGAALAIASRVLLEAASPWFNGNPYYSDFKRTSDGELYFSQTKDNTKWGKAAVMAKRVIDTGQYELFTVSKDRNTPQLPDNVPTASFPDGAGDIDPYHSYSDMFTAEETAINISEFIWSCSETTNNAWISFPAIMGGGNGLCISQQLVDAYRMNNGKLITDADSGYPSDGEAWKAVGTDSVFSSYTRSKDAAKMYDKRDVRFYATIGYNYTYREGSSYTGTTANHKNLWVTYYKDGTGAAWSDLPDDRTMSGYTCLKYCHPSDCPGGTYRSKYFPIIRYAEVLLNYVEAMNEMEDSYTDEENDVTVTRDVNEMVKYFNMIRYRAGMPGITVAEAQNRDTMRELIKNERQVEFACEGRRFYDLRRWGDLTKTLSEPFVGMNVDAKASERQKFHTRTQMTWKYSIYVVNNKFALYPIRQGILDRNTKLDQNPGW